MFAFLYSKVSFFWCFTYLGCAHLQEKLMEDHEQRKKRKYTLGYIPWLSLRKTWSLSMLGQPKEASSWTLIL